ncbi:MAG TPA: peptide ABC transporter substrate-binding protein [Opitutaceae bacterium]|nr:peptide ABC transporter substrate-binding protein [Opitutaceae bacterium]
MSLRHFAVCVAFSLAAFLPSGCGKRETLAEAGRRTGTLHLALGSEPGELDPQRQINIDQMNVSLALFEGLTALDERTSLPVAGAAESWTTSADGLIWTFHLRPGLRWSDGAPLTAEDFEWSLRRALSPALASEYAYVLYPIRGAEAFNSGRPAETDALGVRAVDARTLELTLAHPTPLLPAILALPVAFPVPRQALAAAAQSGDERRWTRPQFLVGNGPFKLVEWSPNHQLVAERNVQFHEPARLNRLVFHPYEQAAAQEAAFRAGQLHITSELPATRLAHYRAESPAALRTEPVVESNFLRFNTTRPPFDDPRVRRAFALAVDRQSLVERVARGGQAPGAALCPASLPGYTPPPGFGHSPTEAKALLAAAGFPEGRGFPAVEAITFNTDLNLKVLEALQQRWQDELGVTVALAPKEKNVWIADERRLAYQISLARWIADYADPIAFLELFLAASGNNATGWGDAEYDRLVQSAAAEADAARRNARFRSAEQRLLDATPVAPLYHGTRSYLADPAVRGWEPALLGFRRYQHVSFE